MSDDGAVGRAACGCTPRQTIVWTVDMEETLEGPLM